MNNSLKSRRALSRGGESYALAHYYLKYVQLICRIRSIANVAIVLKWSHMNSIPKSVQNVLWSYDVNKIDLLVHKKLIIAQVLNFGTKEATDWLFRTYTVDEIRKIAEMIPSGQWDRKSLALWSLYLRINPKPKLERVMNG